MPGLAQLGLVRTKGFSSWLTRLVTRSNWNHIVLYEGAGNVISCEPSGVSELPVEDFPNAVWSNFDLTIGECGAAINFARSQLGKPYGNFTYVWIGVALLLKVKHTPAWILRRLASQRDWICSQLCDSSYQAANIHLFKDERPYGCVWPGSFEPIFKAHGWLK